MQKFTLLHDGSDQGWQATYLALHIAARLGAPVQVLHIDAEADPGALDQRAAQVETSGNAAGVRTETGFLTDLSMNALGKLVSAVDGFFVPQRLISDGDLASRLLVAYACPVWVACREPEIHRMAILVDDPADDARMLEFTRALSKRLGQSLTGFIREGKYDSERMKGPPDLNWLPLQEFSPARVALGLKRLDAGLLILPAANASLAGSLPCNCILHPGA